MDISLDAASTVAVTMELLERDAPLAELTDALRRSTTRGEIVLLAGEAGAGKSSLLHRFREQHGGRARILIGGCDPLSTPRALGPLHDVSAQTGGRLAALLAASPPREEIFAAVVDELNHGGRAQALVVEDAHWADAATLDLLVFLGRRIGSIHALLVISYRDDEVAADHPLRTAIGRLPSASVARVPLAPLSDAAVDELARQAGWAGPAATSLNALTGGNPLLVTEVISAGDTGVPPTITDLALARLAALPAAAQQVARLVAVVPTRTEHWVIDAALDADPTAVDATLTGGLLVADEHAVGYRHELLRQAVEQSLPAATRRQLNRQVLTALSGDHGRLVDAARLAHHARAAGDDAAVLRFALPAARAAAALAAHREAAQHYRAMMPVIGALPALEQADVLEAYSVEAYIAGFSTDAIVARQRAVDLRRSSGDDLRVGDGLRWLSRLYWWSGDRDQSETHSAAAIELLSTLPPSPQLAMAYSNKSQLDMLAGLPPAAISWAERAIELAERLGDDETLAHALNNIGTARIISGDLGGEADLERSAAVGAAIGSEDHVGRALVNLATSAAETRDYARARPALARALEYLGDHDLHGYIQHLHGHRARVRLDEGDWAGAEQDALTALTEPAQAGHRVIEALAALGLIQARRGAAAAATTLDDAARRADAMQELQFLAPVAAARAEHAWLLGDDARAIAELTATYELALTVDHPWRIGYLSMWRYLAGAPVTTDREVAPPYRLLFAGDWRAAAAAWDELGFPYERALALAEGDDEATIKALHLLDGLGATAAAQRIRRRLRAAGAVRVPRGPIRSTAANPAGLTRRQLDVLAVLDENRTTAEIAARLSVSTKTVEHHLSALYRKLGVQTRREAVAAARDLGVIPGRDGKDREPPS